MKADGDPPLTNGDIVVYCKSQQLPVEWRVTIYD
jgi:hypothetical protein